MGPVIRYPDTPGRYVFFQSLLQTFDDRNNALAHKTGRMGQYYLTQQGKGAVRNSDIDINKISNEIFGVTKGLKAMADTEFAKEKAYIEYQKSKLDKSLFNISIPDHPHDDWTEFVTMLNIAKTGKNNFFEDMREEHKRISDNIEYMDNIAKKLKKGEITQEEADKARKRYRRSKQYNITKRMIPLVERLFGTKRSSKNSYANIIKDYLLQHHLRDLIYVDKNRRLAYDSEKFNSLVIASVQMIFQEIADQGLQGKDVFGEDKTYEKRLDSFSNWMKKNEKTSGILKLTSLLQNPFAKNMIATAYRDKIVTSSKQIQGSTLNAENQRNIDKYNKNRKKGEKQITKAERQTIADLINGSKWIKVHSDLKQPKGEWMIAELNDAAKAKPYEILVGAGSPSVKVDNIFIETSIELDEAKAMAIAKGMSEALEDKYSYLNKEGDDDFSTENWLHRQEALRDYEKMLVQMLEEEGNLDALVNSFIIETSDKMYESAGAKAKTFSGGSIGPDLASQLEKINILAETGGFSIGDINWLTAAVINSHPSTVIGTSIKSKLEQYLSVICGALLFDDSLEIIEQSNQKFAQEKPSTTIKTIHLFFMQGFGYFPLSMILYFLYEEMTKTATELSGLIKNGVKVKIKFGDYPQDIRYGEKNNGPELTLSAWEKVSQEAQAVTMLKMTFLGKFLDLLEHLMNPGGKQ